MIGAGVTGVGEVHCLPQVDRRVGGKAHTRQGVDGDGEQTTFKAVVTKTGKDTLTWEALERTGGFVEGPSPVYTYKRVERKKKAAK